MSLYKQLSFFISNRHPLVLILVILCCDNIVEIERLIHKHMK